MTRPDYHTVDIESSWIAAIAENTLINEAMGAEERVADYAKLLKAYPGGHPILTDIKADYARRAAELRNNASFIGYKILDRSL